jgi:hypothetical protein
MKKLIPLMLGMGLMFGAVTMFAGPQDTKSTAKKTKSTAPKKAKKSTATKS